MNQENQQKKDGNMLPVFRFDLENRLVYANLPALPLMQEWKCRINEKVPAEVISHYPELFQAWLSHRPTDMCVEFNNCTIRFSIVPFPEARYIGMYAYAMEVTGRIVCEPTAPAVAETVLQEKIRL
jgi:hypothetical protein